MAEAVLNTADILAAGGASADQLAAKANIASPALTGSPTAPTPTEGDNTTKIATTEFVTTAVAAGGSGVTSFNTRTGAVTLTSGDVTDALTYTPANIASPTFTGVPAAPTAADGTNTTQLATTAFVQSAVAGGTAGVASFNSRTGIVSLLDTDVTGALGYTPFDAAGQLIATQTTSTYPTGESLISVFPLIGVGVIGFRSSATGLVCGVCDSSQTGSGFPGDPSQHGFAAYSGADQMVWNGSLTGTGPPTWGAGDLLEMNYDEPGRQIRFRVNGGAYTAYQSLVGKITGQFFAAAGYFTLGETQTLVP